jgi:hypothetical protein
MKNSPEMNKLSRQCVCGHPFYTHITHGLTSDRSKPLYVCYGCSIRNEKSVHQFEEDFFSMVKTMRQEENGIDK